MAIMLLNGDIFRDLVVGACEYFRDFKQEVDSLNVFPVPDGDTGTNMFLTLSSAASAVEGKEGLTLAQASELVSQGALMGARGNSGVILSQIFRGFARHLVDLDSADPKELAGAFDEAVATAYKAVMKPVEGTILTVLRAARDGAKEVKKHGATLEDILQSAIAKGKETLAKTPDMLPVLKQAGVVDAGGMGLIRVLEGALKGLGSEIGKREIGKKGDPQSLHPFSLEDISTSDILYPYDVQLLVVGEALDQQVLHNDLEPLGDSLLVVGEEKLLRVHVHTDRPGQVLDECQKHGVLSQVTIDNMVEQSKEAFHSEPTPKEPKEVGIVSVATGDGLKRIMESLGCDLVIDGGNTMNPSTEDLTKAIKSINAKRTMFFPNNGNIFLAAKQAKKLIGRNMYIIPSKTIPQGISALLSVNTEETMRHNLKRASKAIKAVRTGEVTYAARDSKFGRHTMKQGDIIGLLDGKVEHVGKDPREVLLNLIGSMKRKDDEILTVFHGEDVSPEAAQQVMAQVQEKFGEDLEIEFHDGGQPLYYYIVSTE